MPLIRCTNVFYKGDYPVTQLTNERSSKIQTNFTLEGTVLENVESIKYLGVTITNNLKWNTHISNV